MKMLRARDLKAMLDREEDFILLNVLGPEDFAKEHIPGSRNIPADSDNFVNAVEALAERKDRTIVVYCASKDCQASPRAARTLTEAGFTDVADFEGGMAEWRLEGYSVVSGEPASTTS